MKRSIIYLIFTSSTVIFSQENQYTDYIMNLLFKSKTMLMPSGAWKKDAFKDKEAGNSKDVIHTAYAQTNEYEYFGVFAQTLKLNENGVKSSFRIERKRVKRRDGTTDYVVVVKSQIDIMEIKKARTKQDVENFRKLAQDTNGSKSDLSDSYSQCSETIHAFFNEVTQSLETKRHIRCRTTQQLQSFIKTLHLK